LFQLHSEEAQLKNSQTGPSFLTALRRTGKSNMLVRKTCHEYFGAYFNRKTFCGCSSSISIQFIIPPFVIIDIFQLHIKHDSRKFCSVANRAVKIFS